ncbi:MAG: lytic transglycosylase domain-containing protein [Alphaproteobacteria bacterium]
MAGLIFRWWRALMLAAIVLGQPVSVIAAQDAGPKRAAGDTVALAMQYETGLSVPRDYGRAMALYCDAARRGDPRAFYGIGWMYLNGRGVARDDRIAAMWLRKAANRGVAQASNILQLISQVPPVAERDCPPPTATRYARGTIHPRASAPPEIRSVIDETAQNIGINTRLLHSVVLVESGFDPRAVSPKMAAGLMQLMPETAVRFGVRDRFDPRENVHAGARYLRMLIDKYNGNLTLALAAYNAGEKAVEAHGGVPPYQETKAYVDAIKRLCGCGE